MENCYKLKQFNKRNFMDYLKCLERMREEKPEQKED